MDPMLKEYLSDPIINDAYNIDINEIDESRHLDNPIIKILKIAVERKSSKQDIVSRVMILLNTIKV